MNLPIKWFLISLTLFFYLTGLAAGLLIGEFFSNLIGAIAAVFIMVIIGLTSYLVIHSTIINPLQKLQNSLKNIGEKDFEVRLDGGSQNEIGGLFGAFNTMVVDLKAIIEKLEQDKNLKSADKDKFEVVLSGISDAIIAVDLDQKIQIFNSAAQNLTGYSTEEVIGHHIGKVIRVFDRSDELLPFDYCPVNSSNSEEGVAFTKKDLKIVGKNKEFFANLVAGKIKGGTGINLGCILALHDTSEEKRLEEMKLDFVSMAAHELRTPLTSLRGYLSVLIKETKNTLGADDTMFLSRANISAQQLSALIENLLNVSRIENHKLTINIEPVDIRQVIQQAIDQIMERAIEKKITLELKKDDTPLPKVLIDKLRIGEVINNILSNAIAYTNDGGRVTVWTERKDEDVVTHVQDTGEGISKESLPHLFTKFFRISGKLEQTTKGTGLGLYISKEIIQMHHGEIWVESELGKGSTFSFSLPTESKSLVLDFK